MLKPSRHLDNVLSITLSFHQLMDSGSIVTLGYDARNIDDQSIKKHVEEDFERPEKAKHPKWKDA